MKTGSDNKNSYFAVSISIPSLILEYDKLDQVDTEFDLILSAMQASSYVSRFERLDKKKIIYVFGTTRRKRKGQLIRLCEKFLKSFDCAVDALTKSNFTKVIDELKNNQSYKNNIDPSISNRYRGLDIKLFNDRKNWYEWQSTLYDKLFLKGGTFKVPDPRKIIFILDQEGNCGKSSFFKWLYFNHPQDIGRITYGTSSQLRSSVLNIGPKKLYIVDLPRTKGKEDRIEELLSVGEDLKSGAITSNMRGHGATLLMEPPHVIFSSNYVIDQNALSEDRWESYEIIKNNKKLKDITKKLKRSNKRSKLERSLGKELN